MPPKANRNLIFPIFHASQYRNILTLFFIYFQTRYQMNKGLDRTDLLLSEDRSVANDFQKHL